MNILFELDKETRHTETQHPDGTYTLYTLKRYADGTEIAYAQEADETRALWGDIYDVEWDETRWQAAQRAR